MSCRICNYSDLLCKNKGVSKAKMSFLIADDNAKQPYYQHLSRLLVWLLETGIGLGRERVIGSRGVS